jgi:predicted acylesterase/phospholipase RssA
MKGGGVKGLAFLGAIPVLERNFRFSSYVGTSAGAIAAVLLAAGYTASEVEVILRQKNFGDFFDGGWWRLLRGKLGAHSGVRVSTWIEELVTGKLGLQRTPTMSDLPHRATVFAASTKDRSPVIFDTEGPNQDVPVGLAVRASAAIPGWFEPVPFNGDMLVDGGAVCNFAFDEIQRREPRRLLMGLYLKPEPQRPIASPVGVIRAALSVILAQRETEVVEENSASVAVIDPSPIATLTVPLSQGQQDLLVQAGQVAALELLQRNGILTDREESIRAQRKLEELRARANAGWLERIRAMWNS